MKTAIRIPGMRLLHSPGPTRVPDEVVNAMARQPTDLADARLPLLIGACESGMKALLQTERAEVFFYSANGHGGWEAVIANLVAPGASVLVPGTGHFSDGWAEQVEAFGGVAVRTPYREGFPIDPAAVEATLRDDAAHRIGAVFVVHTDTASGTTCDLAAIRAAIDAANHPALFVVDVVASLAAAPFAMDALGVNVAIGASQKGLMVHPGLAFVAADARALEFARSNPTPRFYWDWQRRQSDMSYRKFCGTPPLAHMAGLEAALGLIASEGLANVQARHARLARAVHAAVACWGDSGALRLFTQVPAARSVSVTAIEVAPGVDPEALRTVARERFQVAVAGGLGPLSGRVFRIGHLGDMNEAMILGCLAGVEAAMQVQGIAAGRHGVDAAVAALVDAPR
ncbi:MAG TPA: aminotransferase class V-fold PLP-dependent enzyme [Caldimonas sp.]|jgi:alanine-glyoxylate transaminase/serine-glyoxylate transaminase/serine-pyruvate transaminase|nr:aminotransferase class V-fold PLP-dependent enzyme [Caldimonas sp.]